MSIFKNASPFKDYCMPVAKTTLQDEYVHRGVDFFVNRIWNKHQNRFTKKVSGDKYSGPGSKESLVF